MKKIVLSFCMVLLFQTVAISDNVSSRASLHLNSLSQLSGVVKDAVTGEVIVGATVKLLYYPSEFFLKGTNSDAVGHFIFRDVPPQIVLLRVTHIGYEPYQDVFDLQTITSVEVPLFPSDAE